MRDILAGIGDWFSGVIGQFALMRFADIVDILLLTVVLYYVYRFVRDRRAGKLAVGILLLLLLLALSELFSLHTISFLMQNIFQVGLIALVILFQPELRAALEKMGGEPIKSLRSIGEQKNIAEITGVIDEICEAASDMARKKTGALIIIERGTKLGDIIRSGVEIDSKVNAYLLKNIFFNKAPLHDGAVIIRNYRICAAGCFLPLTQNEELAKELGTRHRAAIGMSEVSDAVVIVVSEERGTISVAVNGKLTQGYNYQMLKQMLTEALISGDARKRPRLFKRRDRV